MSRHRRGPDWDFIATCLFVAALMGCFAYLLVHFATP